VFRDGSYFVLAPFQTPCRNTVSMEWPHTTPP
jgi:hypothetical protein